MKHFVATLCAALLSSLVACGGGGSGDGKETGTRLRLPEIEVSPSGGQVTVTQALGAAGQSEHIVRIINTGEATLVVGSVDLSSSTAGGAEAFHIDRIMGACEVTDGCSKQVFRAADGPAPPFSVRSPAQEAGAEGFDYAEVVVVFEKPSVSSPREATLRIASNADGHPLVTVVFSTEQGIPRAAVSPKAVDFGPVGIGQVEERTIHVANVGTDVLVVERLDFTGSGTFALGIGDEAFEPGDPVALDPPVEVGAGLTLSLTVTFSPLTADAALGSIVVHSNDPSSPAGVEVLLQGNTTGPRIKVNPTAVGFGAMPVGMISVRPVEVRNVGTAPLEITSITLDSTGSPDFALIPASPQVLGVNQSMELEVRYVPDSANPVDDAGQTIEDEGALIIASNALDGEVRVRLHGHGAVLDCPKGIINVDEGEEVVPQTTLHLGGDQSFSPTGAIAKWEWSVEQPAGSQSLFIPSATFPNPTFEANVAGPYLFRLVVTDENGEVSCQAAERMVVVIPDEAIHVELLWNTPNDPDQTDEGPEAGADVDLHFLHPYASGPDIDGDGTPDGWFDQPFDCFWFNATPNWGSFDPAVDDDPGLDRDDTDGAGPENMNLDIPEAGKTYRIGVHYWHDHKYGPSYVTVRVYVYSELVFELSDVKLYNHDMWDVATVAWPSGVVTLQTGADGGYLITPEYENPYFYQP